VIGDLLATDLGVWMLTHAKAVEDDGVTRYVPTLDPKVLTYVNGAVQFVFLAETLGPKRVLHTAAVREVRGGQSCPAAGADGDGRDGDLVPRK
jgi:hypothetical protein